MSTPARNHPPVQQSGSPLQNVRDERNWRPKTISDSLKAGINDDSVSDNCIVNNVGTIINGNTSNNGNRNRCSSGNNGNYSSCCNNNNDTSPNGVGNNGAHGSVDSSMNRGGNGDVSNTGSAGSTKEALSKVRVTLERYNKRMKPVRDWIYKSIVGPAQDLGRLELAHQEHVLRKVYERQPRHVGYFVLRLISTVDWIPRCAFDSCCLLLEVFLTFVIQLFDLGLVVLLRGLLKFPWASTLFYGLLITLPRIPYAYWSIGDYGSAVLDTLVYIAWVVWMSYLYISKPEMWMGYGYGRTSVFEVFNLLGPYVLLFAAAVGFGLSEMYPITEPLFFHPGR